jgi:haloalkane dehalogenase
VVVFDFLGWGESDKPIDHQYTFANQAVDLDAVIEGLGAPTAPEPCEQPARP